MHRSNIKANPTHFKLQVLEDPSDDVIFRRPSNDVMSSSNGITSGQLQQLTRHYEDEEDEDMDDDEELLVI